VRPGTLWVPLALTLAVSGSGCAYYNAMWSAEKFAKEARRLEERGREPEARAQWGLAAMKAESVMTRHPRSRWADDALVLRGEGLARAGSCDAAAAPIAEALAGVSDASLRERAGLAAAQCALTTGKPVDAERVLGEALASTDDRRRSRAEYLAGSAAASRLDYDAAVSHFRRSREPGALPARARAHLAAGRADDAGAVLDTLAAGRFNAAEWTNLLTELAARGDADAASGALDRMLVRARVPAKDAAQLLIDDGDRRLAAGDLGGAATRYRQAAAAGPAGDDGVARVREQRVLAARTSSRGDLKSIIAEVTRVARAGEGGGGSGAGEARQLLALLARVVSTPETPGAAFRVAELARDSLGAPRLAGRLMLDLAAADTASLYAPKALVAALALLPERHDSIVGVLDRAYASSPYTRALRGEASPAYAAAEDSLAREMGVQLARVTPGRAARAGALLLTGPRGPWLDDAPNRGTPVAGDRTARPARDRPGTPPARPDRPARP
jgi:tetratricopeptide (TPR) repeat protein